MPLEDLRRPGPTAAGTASRPVEAPPRPTTWQAGLPGGVDLRPPRPRARGRVGPVVVALSATLAITLAVLVAVTPYERPLTGYLDGERELVETTCDPPFLAAFQGGDDALLPGGTWEADPPCGRSAAYRLGLSGLLLLGGVVAAAVATWRFGTAPPEARGSLGERSGPVS